MNDIFETEELVQTMTEELNYEDFDANIYLYNRYGIDLVTFTRIVEHLIDFSPVLKSPITGTISHCFGEIENTETRLFREIVKKDIKND